MKKNIIVFFTIVIICYLIGVESSEVSAPFTIDDVPYNAFIKTYVDTNPSFERAEREAVEEFWREYRNTPEYKEELKEDLITVAIAGMFLYMLYKLYRIIFWP